jgi:hypothetical protein
MNARLAWLMLVLIAAAGVWLHAPALTWLQGAADSAEFSFHPDDKRFVLAALDIKAPNPDGYPQGMVSQLYAAHWLASRFMHVSVVEVLHAISIFYFALSILLTYVFARFLQLDRGVALLSAALLAVAPLAVVEANFGTADTTATFYFYATLLAGGYHLRTRSQLGFIAFCALMGMAIAVKFFVPLFVPLALVIACQPRGRRIEQALTAGFVIVASFEALSLFRFTPWDLWHLFLMLRDDNVVLDAAPSDIIASGPLSQFARYVWGLVAAVGVPCAVFASIALVRGFRALPSRARELKGKLHRAGWIGLISPLGLVVVALVVQGELIVMSRIHAERHILVFVPIVCVVAAQSLFRLLGGVRLAKPALAVSAAVILAVEGVDAVEIEDLYRTDVRKDMVEWTRQRISVGGEVVVMAPFSNVRGTRYDQRLDPRTLGQNGYVLTCDFEYQRYLPYRDARKIFHPMGGQARVDFFQSVLVDGTSEFGVVREFASAPRGFVLNLVDANLLPSLGTFVPRRCLALGRQGQLDSATQQRIRVAVAGAGRGW